MRINAAYADGINYTQADQFEWTLPDFSTLTPGNSVAGFEALVGEVSGKRCEQNQETGQDGGELICQFGVLVLG